MADDDILRRLDAHLERSNEHMARGNELMDRSSELMGQIRAQLQLSQEARGREEALTRRVVQLNQRAFDAFSVQMQENTQVLRDLQAETLAQRGALMQMLDRMDRWPPGPEPA